MKSSIILLLILCAVGFKSCNNKQEVGSGINTQVDSLRQANSQLKKELKQLQKEDSLSISKPSEIQIDTLVGSFTEVSMADCFHLSFKDKNGKVWNFDNSDNIYGIDILDTQDELKLKKGISSKVYKIWYANLKGIDCASADSYYDSKNRKFIDMPTIIKVEEVKG